MVPLYLELAGWLDLARVLDFRQHTSTDEDLSRLGFVAKTRGDVGRTAAKANRHVTSAFEFGFGSPAAEMKMASVAEDRLFQFIR
jgi:hypothetical protein